MQDSCSLARFAGPIALFLAAAVGSAQQKVEWNNKFNIPVAPTGLAHRPLPDHPVEFDTAEGTEDPRRGGDQGARISVERRVSSRWQHAGDRASRTLAHHSQRSARSQADRGRTGLLLGRRIGRSPGAVHGYMDIALHPRFAENHLLYLTYTKPLDGGKRTTAIARGRWDGSALADVKDIFVLDEAGTSRIAFGSDGMLYYDHHRQGSAGSQHARRQGAAPARRRHRAARQSVRGTSGSPAGSVHAGASQRAGPGGDIREPARCGRTKTAPTAATRSTS